MKHPLFRYLSLISHLALLFCLVSCQSVQKYVEQGELEKGEAYCDTLKGDEQVEGLVLLGGEYESIGNLTKAADLYHRAGNDVKLEVILEKASMDQENSFTKLSDTSEAYNKKIEKSLRVSELPALSELCLNMIDTSVEASDHFALYLELCHNYDEARMKEINDAFYIRQSSPQEGITVTEKGKTLNRYLMISDCMNAGISTFVQISGTLVKQEIEMMKLSASTAKLFGTSYKAPKYTKTQEDFLHIAETVPVLIENDKRTFAVLSEYHAIPEHDETLQELETLNAELQETIAKLK